VETAVTYRISNLCFSVTVVLGLFKENFRTALRHVLSNDLK